MLRKRNAKPYSRSLGPTIRKSGLRGLRPRVILPGVAAMGLALWQLGPALSSAGASTPAAPCPKHMLCQTAPSSATTARKHLDSALSSGSLRRGLGFPSMKRLLGRHAKSAQKAAEGRLLAHSSSIAAASGAHSTRTTVGGVKVSTTASVSSGEESGQSIEDIRTTEHLRRGPNSEFRSLHIAAAAELTCPEPVDPQFKEGRAPGTLHAEQLLRTVERAGRYTIDTNLALEIERTKTSGGIDPYTELVALGIYTQPTYVTITRTRRVIDSRTGKVIDERPLKMHAEIMDLWREVWLEPDPTGFEDFVNGVKRNPADNVVNDQLMNEDAAWKEAEFFTEVAVTRLRSAYESAEPYWTKGNRCLTPSVEVPAQMSLGQRVTIQAKVSSTRGFPTPEWGHFGSWCPYPGGGLIVEPYDCRIGDSGTASASWTIVAPSHDWSSPLTLRLWWRSKVGMAETTVQIGEMNKSPPPKWNGTYTETYKETALYSEYDWTLTGHLSYGIQSAANEEWTYGLNGTIEYTVTGHNYEECPISGTGTVPVGAGDPNNTTPNWSYLDIWAEPPDPRYSAAATSFTDATVTAGGTCEGSTEALKVPRFQTDLSEGSDRPIYTPGATTLSGEWQHANGVISEESHWNFQASS